MGRALTEVFDKPDPSLKPWQLNAIEVFIPWPVGRDLRERVIQAIEQEKLTQGQAASRVKRGPRKLKLTRKKEAFRASERDLERVGSLRERVEAHEPRLEAGRLVLLEGTGRNVAMTRTCARPPEGVTLLERLPRNRGTTLTVIGALDLEGLCALLTMVGGTTGDVFYVYARDLPLPELEAEHAVVLAAPT